MAISASHFQELLSRAKAASASRKEKEAASLLQQSLSTHKVEEVDMQSAGGSNDTDILSQEQNVEVITNLLDSQRSPSPSYSPSLASIGNSVSPPSSLTTLLAARLKKVKEEKERKEAEERGTHFSTSTNTTNINNTETGEYKQRVLGVARDDITLNDKQFSFNKLVLSGSDCVLIGAAGTGKTTSMRTVTRNLIADNKLSNLTIGTKHLVAGKPGAAILSYTRKAVNNIRHAVVEELKAHTLTIHKLLEFGPEFYEIEDPNSPGSFKKTMRFIPGRNSYNPLPRELSFLAFEESSMISTILYEQLQEAMPHEHQEVFLGDIQQLPPIFGQAILGFKMLELPVIELTEVYRQAAESPIIDLAWKILKGDPEVFNPKTITKKVMKNGKLVDRISVPSLDKLSKKVILADGSESEVVFQVWQKALNEDYANLTAIRQFCAWSASGYYNPQEDIILCPFNKGVGTIEINKGISDYLGKQKGAEVHEVIAGFNKHYLAVGDRVLYDKEDAFITSIRRTAEYLGKSTLPSSPLLDRWGHLEVEKMTLSEKIALDHKIEEESSFDLEAVEAFMNSSSFTGGGGGGEGEERVQLASHTIEIRYSYSDPLEESIVLKSAAEVNNLLGGYCITVYKFQGSEAERVFLLYHHSHHVGVMMSREALYTADTRAKRFLHIICEKDSFYKGVKLQVIKGNTLEEKAEWFKGKQSSLPSSSSSKRDERK